jgi:O-antigen ligase
LTADVSRAPTGRLRWLLTALLFLFYVFALVVDRSAGVIYALLVLAGVVALLAPRKLGEAGVSAPSAAALLRRYWPLALCMAGPLLAVLANEISRGGLSSRSVDAPSRLALFILVLFGVRRLQSTQLRTLQWAFVLGALLATVKLYILTEGGKVRYGTDFIPMIIFTGMTLLLGMFAALSVGWQNKRTGLGTALKVLAAIAAVVGSYLSQSRGTWLVLALFLLLGWFIQGRRGKGRGLTAVLLVLALGAAASGTSIVQDRVAAARNDIALYNSGADKDTSLGLRFQLWHGSLVLWREHPLFGVGVDRYKEALEGLAARGVISPLAATFPHSHNEVLFAAARTGGLGVLALLALYLVPAVWFGRHLRHADPGVRATAGMGLSLSLGILVLGLTDVVFLWWEVYPFYSIGIAVFASDLDQRLNGQEPARQAEGKKNRPGNRAV